MNANRMAVYEPAKLPRLVLDIFNKEQWVSMSADVKGDAYKGMLEKNGQDTKSGKVRAQVSVIVKGSLRKYGYPPDKQEKATQTVLEQAELLPAEWAV